MNNKNMVLVLLCGVLAVWGLICYKIYRAIVATDVPKTTISQPKEKYFKEIDHTLDTVMLSMNYSNPFNSSIDKVMELPTVPKKLADMPQAIAPLVNWNDIQYIGYVNNQKRKSKIALMTIRNMECMLTEGKSMYGVTLLTCLGDSIKVVYQGETLFIKIRK
jgi:hypothetical protein